MQLLHLRLELHHVFNNYLNFLKNVAVSSFLDKEFQIWAPKPHILVVIMHCRISRWNFNIYYLFLN